MPSPAPRSPSPLTRSSKPFTESYACASRAHCPTCRARTPVGAAFRANVGAPEGECPHGVPWGFVAVRVARCAVCHGPHPTEECTVEYAAELAEVVAEIDKRPEGLGDTV